MAIRTHCPECGHPTPVKEDSIGKTIRCSNCDAEFEVSRVEFGDAETGEPGNTAPGEEASDSMEPLEFETEALGKVGRFELREAIGQGGFGTVYRAYDPVLEREVALKVPRLDPKDEKAVERFLAEAKAAANLRHPNIVPVFETGVADEGCFIAAELVEGEPLSVEAESDLPDYQEIATWIRDLGHGLAHAHSEGIVHRDVKPQNVLLNQQGRPQLTDFGLARKLTDEAAGPKTKRPFGTPAYMPPEQARGDAEAVGPWSDQYSLGVVLYHLLAGKTPFQGNATEVIQAVQKETPKVPSTIRDSVPRDLEAICLKAMAKDPEDRFADCQAMSDDLDRYLRGELIHARRHGPVELLTYWSKRHPKVAGWTAAAIALAGAILIAQTVMLLSGDGKAVSPEDKQANTTDTTTETATDNREVDVQLLHQSELDEYATTLNMAKDALYHDRIVEADDLLRTCRWDFRGFEHDYLRKQVDGGIRTLRGHTGKVNDIAFTDDGRLVATASDDGTVRVWEVATGRQVGRYDACAGKCVACVPLPPACEPGGGKDYVFASSAPDGKLAAWRFSYSTEPWKSKIEQLWLVETGGTSRIAVRKVEGLEDQYALATAGSGGLIALRSLQTGQPLGRPLHRSVFTGEFEEVRPAGVPTEQVMEFGHAWNEPADLEYFQADEKWFLAASYRDGEIVVWETGTDNSPKRLIVETDGAQFDILPSGQVAFAAADRTVRRIDLLPELGFERVDEQSPGAVPAAVPAPAPAPAPVPAPAPAPKAYLRPQAGGAFQLASQTTEEEGDADPEAKVEGVRTVRLEGMAQFPVGDRYLQNPSPAPGNPEDDTPWLAAMAASPSGDTLITAGGGHAVGANTMAVWSLEGAYQHSLPGHRSAITAIEFNGCPDCVRDYCFSGCGAECADVTIASASEDGIVKLWDHRVNLRYEIKQPHFWEPLYTADGRWRVDVSGSWATGSSSITVRPAHASERASDGLVLLDVNERKRLIGEAAVAPTQSVIAYCVDPAGPAPIAPGSQPAEAAPKNDGQNELNSPSTRQIVVKKIPDLEPHGTTDPFDTRAYDLSDKIELQELIVNDDGSRVIYTDGNGTFHLVNMQEGTEIAKFSEDCQLSFLPGSTGGRLLVKNSADPSPDTPESQSPRLSLHSSSDGQEVALPKFPGTWRPGSQSVKSVYSADGLLVLFSDGHLICAFDANLDELVWTHQPANCRSIEHLTVSHDSRRIVVGYSTTGHTANEKLLGPGRERTGIINTILVMEASSGSELLRIEDVPSMDIESLTFGVDDSRLLGLGRWQTIEWNAHIAQPSRRVTDMPAWFKATSVAYHPKEQEMAVGDGLSNTVLIVNTQTGRTREVLDLPGQHLAYNADGSRLLAMAGPAAPCMPAMWPVAAPAEEPAPLPAAPAAAPRPSPAPAPAAEAAPLPAAPKADPSAALPSDRKGIQLASLGSAPSATVLGLTTLLQAAPVEAPAPAPAPVAAPAPAATSVEPGDSSESTDEPALPSTHIVVWDTKGMEALFDEEYEEFQLTTKPAFSPNGKRIYLASLSEGGPVHCIDVASKEISKYDLGSSTPGDLSLSADGKTLAVALDGDASPFMFWKTETGQPIGVGQDTDRKGLSPTQMLQFCFAGKGDRLLFTGYYGMGTAGGTVSTSDMLERKLQDPYHNTPIFGSHHTDWPTSGLAYLSENHTAVGCSDGTIAICDALFESPLQECLHSQLVTLFSHDARISALAGAPAGNQLAAVSADGVMRVWDVEAALKNIKPGCTACEIEQPVYGKVEADMILVEYKACKMVPEQKCYTYQVCKIVPEQRVRTFTIDGGYWEEQVAEVPDANGYAVKKTKKVWVSEIRTKELPYTVWKPVWETRERTCTVCKPVWEICVKQVPLDGLRARAADTAAQNAVSSEPFLVWKADGTLLPPDKFEEAIAQKPPILLVSRDYLRRCRIAPTHFVEDENALIVCPDMDAPPVGLAPAPIPAPTEAPSQPSVPKEAPSTETPKQDPEPPAQDEPAAMQPESEPPAESPTDIINWIRELGGIVEKADVPGIGTLNVVDLSKAKGIDNRAIARIAGLAELQMLVLSGQPIGGDGLKHVARLKKLVVLRLDGTEIINGDLAALEGLPIANLDLRDTWITDGALGHLKKLPSLQRLWVMEGRWSEEAKKEMETKIGRPVEH